LGDDKILKTHLILDAWGVIFIQEDDVEELLIPFLQERIPHLDTNKVRELYFNQVSLGKISSAQFFTQINLPNVATEYLDEYVQIDPDFYGIVQELKEKFVVVMCSNDVSEWSQFLCTKFGLDAYFSHFCISGDVGVRKPDPKMYHTLLAALQISSNQSIFVDNTLRNLEAAAHIGMTTIHFKRSSSQYSYTPDFTVTNFFDLKSIVFKQYEE
jgi:putative hydrolase of the HAD superfamily